MEGVFVSTRLLIFLLALRPCRPCWPCWPCWPCPRPSAPRGSFPRTCHRGSAGSAPYGHYLCAPPRSAPPWSPFACLRFVCGLPLTRWREPGRTGRSPASVTTSPPRTATAAAPTRRDRPPRPRHRRASRRRGQRTRPPPPAVCCSRSPRACCYPRTFPIPAPSDKRAVTLSPP